MDLRAQKKSLILGLILLGLVIWTFAPAGENGFINYDDDVYITDNSHVREGLSWANVAWSFRTTEAGNWHPITWLSHCLDCQLFGLDPRGHHFVGVTLHALNSLLLFWLLKKLTGATWRSFMVAGLFALHPAHVESVAWAAERKDLLSTLFFLMTLQAWTGWAMPSAAVGTHRRLCYGAAFLLFALGLLSKPMLVTLPFVLLLLDFWPLGRWQRSGAVLQRLCLEKAPFFLLSAASCVITFLVQRKAGAVAGLAKLSFDDRIATAVTAGGAYLLKLVYPTNLAVFYPRAQNLGEVSIVLSAAVLVVSTVLALALRSRRPFILMGWLWFLGTLVPVSGLVQVGMQGMADRYTYIPFVGLFIVVAWGAHEFVARAQVGSMLGSAAGFLTLLACAIGARNQAEVWKDSGSLFRHALKVTRDNTVAHLHLGNYLLMQQGDIPQAIIHLQEAARLEPNLTEAHAQLGSALYLAGRREDSIKELELTLLLDPLYTQAQCNLGVALQAVGRLPEAIVHLQEAVRLRPDYGEAQNALGGALAACGRLEEAINHFRQAVRLNPGHAVAHRNLAQALLLHGERDEAMLEFRRAVELQPKDQQALRALDMLEGKAGH